MTSKYSGRCLCGDIKYATNAEPLFAGNCHCKDCQRSSGSAFIPAMPGLLGIKAGTLDHPANYVPKLDFHVASAAPWDHMNAQLPKKQGAAQG